MPEHVNKKSLMSIFHLVKNIGVLVDSAPGKSQELRTQFAFSSSIFFCVTLDFYISYAVHHVKLVNAMLRQFA